jgi:hypothetical protein
MSRAFMVLIGTSVSCDENYRRILLYQCDSLVIWKDTLKYSEGKVVNMIRDTVMCERFVRTGSFFFFFEMRDL